MLLRSAICVIMLLMLLSVVVVVVAECVGRALEKVATEVKGVSRNRRRARVEPHLMRRWREKINVLRFSQTMRAVRLCCHNGPVVFG